MKPQYKRKRKLKKETNCLDLIQKVNGIQSKLKQAKGYKMQQRKNKNSSKSITISFSQKKRSILK